MSLQMPAAGAQTITGGGVLLAPLPRPGTHTPTFLHTAAQWFGFAALAAASYFFISHYVIQSVKVSGKSMQPTLQDSQFYILNRWVYHVRAPLTGEVVVIRDPSDRGFSVKRIIASDGDTVSLKNGQVIVNGRRLSEPYLQPKTLTFPLARGNELTVTCGKDQFFLLGDNRNCSADSRAYGLGNRSDILGLVVR